MGKTLSSLVLSLALAMGISTYAKTDEVPYQKHFQTMFSNLPTKTVKGKPCRAFTISKKENGDETEQYFLMDCPTSTFSCQAKKRQFPKTPKPNPDTKTYGFKRSVPKTWTVDCYKDGYSFVKWTFKKDGKPDFQYHGVLWDYDTPSNRIRRGWDPMGKVKWRPVFDRSYSGTAKEREAARQKFFKSQKMKPGEHHYVIFWKAGYLQSKARK